MPAAKVLSQQPVKRVSSVLAFERPDPRLLLSELDEALEKGWEGWELETISAEVEMAWGTPIGFGSLVLNLLGAVQSLRVSPAAWEDANVLEKIGNTFAGRIPIFDQLQPLDPSELAITLHVMKEIRDLPFGSEIGRYVAGVGLYWGLYFLPPPDLSMGQEPLLAYMKSRGFPIPDLVKIGDLYSRLRPEHLPAMSEAHEDVTILIAKAMAVREIVREQDEMLHKQRASL